MKIDHEKTLEQGLWRAAKSTSMVIAIALGAALTATPAHAETGFEEAHSLRSLDIMLMVTALRCRSGPNDFQADYQRFSATHLQHLNAASRTLKRSFVASYGEPNPSRALDRMGVKIANSYGDGHPWLSCAELQQEARDLSQTSGVIALAENANRLLSATPPQPEPTPRLVDGEDGASDSIQGDAVRIGYNMTAEWEQRP